MPSVSKIMDGNNPSVEVDPRTMQDRCPPLDPKDVQLPEKPGRGRRALYWIKNFFTRGNVDENDPYQRYRDAQLATQKGEEPPKAPDPAEKPSLGRRIWSMVKYIFTLGMVKDETYKKWHAYNKKVRKYNRALKKWVRRERRRQRAVTRLQRRIDAEKARTAEQEKEREKEERKAEPEQEKRAQAERDRQVERDAPRQEAPQAQQEQPQAARVQGPDRESTFMVDADSPEKLEQERLERNAQAKEEARAKREDDLAGAQISDFWSDVFHEEQPRQEEPTEEALKATASDFVDGLFREARTQEDSPRITETQQRAQVRLSQVEGEIDRKAGIIDRAGSLLCPEDDAFRGAEPGERFLGGMITLGLLSDANVQKACLGQDQDISPEAAAANFKAVVDSILTNTPLDDKLLPMVENARKMAVETMDRSAGDRVDITSWGIQAMNQYNRETQHTGGGVLTYGLLENLDTYGKQLDPRKDELSTNLSRRDFKVAQGDVALEQLRNQSLDAQKTVLSAVVNGGQELQQLKESKEQMRSLTGTIMAVGTVEGMLEYYKQQGDKALDRAKVTVSQQAENMDDLSRVMSSTDQMRKLNQMPPERFSDLVIASENRLKDHSSQVLAQTGASLVREQAKQALQPEVQREKARSRDEDDLSKKHREEPAPRRRSNSMRGPDSRTLQ